MGKKKFTGKLKAKKQPPAYYRKNRLTVGMLEDLCGKIADKTTIIEMSDKTGNWPTPCLRGILISNGKTAKGLIIAAKFSWSGIEDDDDDDDDEEDASDVVWPEECPATGEGCPPSAGAQDCLAIRKGIAYIEEVAENATDTQPTK